MNMFFEDSTRTRSSFELAGKWLSADVINVSAKGSSTSKGESLRDTVATLDAMGGWTLWWSATPPPAPPAQTAQWVRASVINAGDGTHEHPTQALLDGFALGRHFRASDPDFDWADKKIAIVGDLTHSRVVRSNVLLQQTLGAQVTLVAPPTLLPSGVDTWPVEVCTDFDAVLGEVDAVMMLRVQRERMAGGFFPHPRGSTPWATA